MHAHAHTPLVYFLYPTFVACFYSTHNSPDMFVSLFYFFYPKEVYLIREKFYFINCCIPNPDVVPGTQQLLNNNFWINK